MFLKSILDFFTSDVPKGLAVIKTDFTHIVSLILGIMAGPVGTFVTAYDVPAVKALLMTPGGLTPAGIIAALVSATLTGLWTISKHAPDNSIQLTAANLVTPDMISKVSAQVAGALTAAKTAAKMILIILFLGMACPLMANPIGVPLNPSGVENDILVMPYTDAGLNLGTSTTGEFGFSYALAGATVTPVDATHVSINPHWFLGFSVLGMVDNSNPIPVVTVNYGPMFGIPVFDGLPMVSFSAQWNSVQRGDAKWYVDLSTPMDLLADVLVRKINIR